MDNASRGSHPNDESHKELSISLAASSMISATDTISPEAYQANLKRIQEVKEMVHRLELNNEAAHKNYIVDQLENRAQEGREAEDMLARLRNQPGLHETVQFTNNAPGDKSEVILPTTASVVEVSDSRFYPPYSSTAPTVTTHSTQTIQQSRPAPPGYQWAPPQIQPNSPHTFPYYAPIQQNMARHSQTTDVRQMGHYAAQNVPPQARVYNPPTHQTGYQQLHVQQPLQSWSGYPHQVIASMGTTAAPVATQGLYAPAAGQITTTSTHGGPGVGSSNSVYRESGFPKESSTSRHPYNTHNQTQNTTPLTSTSQVQVTLQAVPTVPTQAAPAQHPSIRSHPKPVDSQPRPIPTAVSKSTHNELHPPYQQPQQHFQQPPHESQWLPQPSPQPEQHAQQSQAQSSSQQYPQLPQTHLQGPPQSADRASSTHVSQSPNPNRPTQPIVAQEQTRQRSEYTRADQATFVKLFQNAVHRGPSHLKAFWHRAHAYGISEEWFKTAINSLPRDVWQSTMAQISQSESATDAATPANAPRRQPPPNSDSNAPLVSAPSTPTVIPLVDTTPAAQQAAKASTSMDERITNSAPAHTLDPYAAQLQYYAEQATKSSLAQTQTAVVTPRRDVPQGHAAVRTPKDANKSTLAQDILRSLGRRLPKFPRETGIELADKTNKHEDDRQPEEAPLQPVPPATCSTAPTAPTGFDVANSLSTSLAKPNVHDEPQLVASPSLLGGRSVPPEEHRQGAVTEEPIMIDLTLEDSEDSVGGKGLESTFPILTSANTTASQPVPSTNTTNDSLLMENLSLEESSVDVAADGNHLDVRMNNPHLSPAPETNVESNHLPPQPNSAELVSHSFELSPHEAIVYPRDGQLPLFLPSPPISPAPTEPPDTDPEMIYDEVERFSLKRRSVSVDEMEIDRELVLPRVKKRPRKQVYVLIPSAPLYVRKALKKIKGRAVGEGLDSELEGVEEDEESQYSHLEQLLIEESKSRLLERRCRWLNCGSVLNCAANLLLHLKNHVREDSQAPFHCRWATCQRRFHTEQECNIHLEKHATKPLPCPFAGCDEQFDKPVEVMQHEVQHQKADHGEPLIRKPTCEPIVPSIPARLGPPSRQLPSHRVIPRRVFKCRISANRHAILGPWILWNIFSPVEPDMRKQNASMRSGRPVRQAISYDVNSMDARRDDYDFLLALSSYPTKSRQLEDLDSAFVTMSAARGLTLWGSDSESHVNLTAESATPGETRDAVSVTVAVEAAAVTKTNNMSEGRQSGPRSGVGEEEDMVEQILLVS